MILNMVLVQINCKHESDTKTDEIISEFFALFLLSSHSFTFYDLIYFLFRLFHFDLLLNASEMTIVHIKKFICDSVLSLNRKIRKIITTTQKLFWVHFALCCRVTVVYIPYKGRSGGRGIPIFCFTSTSCSLNGINLEIEEEVHAGHRVAICNNSLDGIMTDKTQHKTFF